MAPRDAPKSTTKVKPVVGRTNTIIKSRSSPVSVKKTVLARKIAEKTPLKAASTELRKKINTVPKPPSTPKNKQIPVPHSTNSPISGSVTKSAKKASWKRRPKPAHSGVPVPEKMKNMLQKQLMKCD